MKIQCPHCKAKFNTPDEYRGKKVKCPKCKEQFEVVPQIDVQKEISQETLSDDSGFTTKLLIAVISGALCLVVGLGSGVLLTIPNRGKTKAEIATLETKLNEIQTAAQNKVRSAETETARYRDELKRISAEHERINAELERTKKALRASAQKSESSDIKANPPPVEKHEIVKLNYTVLSENIHDVPIKTQVELNILVSGDISDTGLRKLLNELYSSIKARTGFQYHTSPTNIYIYAFTSKDRYESASGQWIAMLQKSPGDLKPTISINQHQIAQLGKKPEKRFGLSEEERKKIWKEIIQIEDNALKEAEEKFPDQPEKSLRVGQVFRLTKETPLMPELEPADPLKAIGKIQRLTPRTTIKVLEVSMPRQTPWYFVEARSTSRKLLGKGWINSIALVGQGQADLKKQIEKQINLERILIEEHKNKIANKYGLTPEQLKEISIEGISNDWPMPKPVP